MPAALFGITNSGLSLFVNLLILFLVVVWIALIAWTYLDAKRRISDPVLIACATGASLFPYVGTIIYTILRPPEFLDDARERELEMRSSQLRVRQLEEQSCANCGFPIERSYLRCPNCRVRVKDPCESCGKPIDPRWALCPYCETPVRRAEPQRRAPASGRPSGERSKAPSSRPRKSGERPVRSSSERKAARPSSRSAAPRAASSERTSSRSSDGSTTGARTPRREPSGGRPTAAPDS